MGLFQAMLAVPAPTAFNATEVVARLLPKVPARLRAAAKYTCEFDVWGLACTLAYLLTGAADFGAQPSVGALFTEAGGVVVDFTLIWRHWPPTPQESLCRVILNSDTENDTQEGEALSISGAQTYGPFIAKRASSALLASTLPSVGLKPDRVELDPGEETTALTLRVMVKKSLVQADASGHSPLDDLEPDFVPKEAKTANAPVVLAAIEDPANVPAVYRAVSTVALVEEKKSQDLEALNRDYFPAFVPKGGYALSQEAVNVYAEECKAEGYQMGLTEGMQKGAQAAVPAGYQVKLMDSEAGLRIERRRDTVASLAGLIGSTSSALGIAANLGMNAQVAGPLALAVAPLQILGPTGSLSTWGRLEHQKAALYKRPLPRIPARTHFRRWWT